jgi:hypothetical protein
MRKKGRVSLAKAFEINVSRARSNTEATFPHPSLEKTGDARESHERATSPRHPQASPPPRGRLFLLAFSSKMAYTTYTGDKRGPFTLRQPLYHHYSPPSTCWLDDVSAFLSSFCFFLSKYCHGVLPQWCHALRHPIPI